MRTSRVITVFVLLLICLVGLFSLGPRHTQYSRFRHQSDSYYTEFGKACDAILAKHPVGTNRFIELSVVDPSLPKIIRALQPLKITVQSNRVWILRGGSIEFGITWEQDDTRRDVWTLCSACESDVRVLYVTSK